MKTKTGAKKLNKLFGNTAYAAATMRNYEGAPAYVRTDEEQLLRVLMTGSFETQAHPREVSKSDSLASIAKAISGHGGGTSLSAPLEYAFGGKDTARVYDVAVFITDSESWYDHLTRNRGVLDLIREYRQRVNPALTCFFVQLVPYKHAVVPQDEPGCYYIYGWSASILSYIASVVNGGMAQMEAVRQVSVL
jgi:60 kDa SS-A/Ro ribonucleoprotein